MMKGGWLIGASVLVGLLGFFLFAGETTVVSKETVEVIKEQAVTQIKNSFSAESDQQTASSSPDSSSVVVPEEGVPLRQLGLGEAQNKILETAGVDTEAFIVSKEMFLCAEAEVGSDRVAAYVAGETPTLSEMRKLLPCLKAS